MTDPTLDETQPLASMNKEEEPSKEDPLLGETVPLASMKKKNQRKLSRKELIIRLCILGVLLLLVGSGAIFGVKQYQQYRTDLSQAQAGIQHLRNAETLLSKLAKNPFDSKSTTQAQQEFSSALSLFQQVGASLDALPGASTSVPVIGSKVAAAQHLLPLAVEASQMGVTACKTLNLLLPKLRNPMDTTGPKLTLIDLNAAGQNLQQIQSTLNLLVNQVNHLQPEDLQLEPGLAKYVGVLRKDGPKLQDALNQAQSILAVAPVLLGISAPTNYLLEIMDSTELRPGGGFVGSYGTLTLTGGHVSRIFMTDVDLLDKPFEMSGHSIPYPPEYKWFAPLAPGSWSLRDSNLEADFPTSALNGEHTYALEGGEGPLQGVIALTPWFIQGVMRITGPIDMRPEYNETVTAQNLIDRIHYHQLGNQEGSDIISSPDGHSSLRKRFTSYLAEHIMTRVRQLATSPTALSSLLKLLTSSLHTKDIQIYLNSSTAENVLQHYQLASTVQAPAGDSLFVVDANIAANKANDLIKYTMHDQVTIDTSGNAVHHTTLNYAWVLPGLNYGSHLYQDYARIYVPTGSTLQSQNGWQPQGNSQAFGRRVWAGFFTLTAGQTRVITLTWTTPKAAYKDAQGWHYRDLLQKQAGDMWSLDLQVTLPSCASKIHSSGGLLAKSGQPLTFSSPLNEDKSFGIDYACS